MWSSSSSVIGLMRSSNQAAEMWGRGWYSSRMYSGAAASLDSRGPNQSSKWALTLACTASASVSRTIVPSVSVNSARSTRVFGTNGPRFRLRRTAPTSRWNWVQRRAIASWILDCSRFVAFWMRALLRECMSAFRMVVASDLEGAGSAKGAASCLRLSRSESGTAALSSTRWRVSSMSSSARLPPLPHVFLMWQMRIRI